MKQSNQSPQCSSSNSKPYYRSICSSHISDKKKNSHHTMGPAKPDPPHPLRTREKSIELPKITNRNKNFIEENINKIINSLPIYPRRYIVSDRKGNKFLIDGSGLQKDFIHKKNYGQIPLYLQTRKTLNEPMKSQSEDNSMVLLPAEERLCLINNLKDRYKDIFAEYQRLPLCIETISNRMKKTYLTNELITIEHDIHFLEKHQQIFIVNTCSDMKN